LEPSGTGAATARAAAPAKTSTLDSILAGPYESAGPDCLRGGATRGKRRRLNSAEDVGLPFREAGPAVVQWTARQPAAQQQRQRLFVVEAYCILAAFTQHYLMLTPCHVQLQRCCSLRRDLPYCCVMRLVRCVLWHAAFSGTSATSGAGVSSGSRRRLGTRHDRVLQSGPLLVLALTTNSNSRGSYPKLQQAGAPCASMSRRRLQCRCEVAQVASRHSLTPKSHNRQH
jgi:hypothetical protein